MTINLAAIESRNEERRRLRDAATPGPWWRIDPPWGYGDTVHAGNTDDPHGASAFICTSVPMEDDLCESSNVSDDMALIAYARTDTAPEDIAALVAEVRRLEAENSNLRAVLSECSATAYEPCDPVTHHIVGSINGVKFEQYATKEDESKVLDWRLRRDAALTTTTSE